MMGFLKKLFGGGSGSLSGDNDGFFVYVRCENCGDKLRLRIHKQHDLNHSEDGFIWHKTIVDNRCFRPMVTVVNFDRQFQMTSAEIDGGHYISHAEYEARNVSQAPEQESDQS